MRRRFALVHNQTAGLAIPLLLSRVLHELKVRGAEVVPLLARSADEARDQVRRMAAGRTCEAVIAAGGDGTFRAVASGAAGSSLPVGFIPLGTGNVLKFELGLTSDARRLAETLVEGPDIPVRGGLVNGAPFFLMVGAGYDGRIVANLDQRAKRVLGRAAYTMPVLQALAKGAEVFDVEADGKAFEASWVIVTNASHYGGSFVLTKDTHLSAAGLTVTIIEAKSRFGLVGATIALGLGRLARAATRPSFIKAIAAKTVRIGRRVPTEIEIDGDASGSSPVEVVAAGPEVRVIAPAAYVAALTNRHTNHVTSVL